MSNRQLEHNEVNQKRKVFPSVVICENIESPDNVGMIFRNCEAMGVSKIIFTGTSVLPPNRKIRKVSRSTDKLVEYLYVVSTIEAINLLAKEDYIPLAIEVSECSISVHTCLFSNKEKYAFIVGSEKHGVSAETLDAVNQTIEIPMFGLNTSINVVSALTIVLYEYSKQLTNVKTH